MAPPQSDMDNETGVDDAPGDSQPQTQPQPRVDMAAEEIREELTNTVTRNIMRYLLVRARTPTALTDRPLRGSEQYTTRQNVHNKLNDLRDLGWVASESGVYSLTPAGRHAAAIGVPGIDVRELEDVPRLYGDKTLDFLIAYAAVNLSKGDRPPIDEFDQRPHDSEKDHRQLTYENITDNQRSIIDAAAMLDRDCHATDIKDEGDVNAGATTINTVVDRYADVIEYRREQIETTDAIPMWQSEDVDEAIYGPGGWQGPEHHFVEPAAEAAERVPFPVRNEHFGQALSLLYTDLFELEIGPREEWSGDSGLGAGHVPRDMI